MLTRRVALVDRTKKIPFDELSNVAAALNLQVQRDLAPIWHVSATVSALPSAQKIPVGICPIFIVDNLPPGEGGIHLTKQHQPYALVERGDGWTVAASHECLEMLVDPSGNHLHASTAIHVLHGKIQDTVGKFEYLVEVCDPSEDDPFAYAVDDVTVSDFYTPHFFDPVVSSGVRYSFTGALTHPREVRKNGYLSWLNPLTGTMQQLKYFDHTPHIVDLGVATGVSLRAFVDRQTQPTVRLSQLPKTSPQLAATAERAVTLGEAATQRARQYG